MPSKNTTPPPPSALELASIADRHDSKVRALFQLLYYISLVKYDPELAKLDRSSEFKRFKTRNDLDIWDAVSSKAETRKATKKVKDARNFISRIQPPSKHKLASVAPIVPSTAVKRKGRPPNPANKNENAGNSLIIDDDLGLPPVYTIDQALEPLCKRRKREPVITSPLHYIKPQFENLDRLLKSYKTIADDNEPISEENWQKKITLDAEVYARVKQASETGILAEIERRGVSSETKIPRFIDPPRDLSFYDNLLQQTIQLSKQRTNLRKYHQAITRRNTQSIEQYFRRLAGAEDRERKEQDRLIKQIAKRVGQEVMKKWKLAEKVVEQRKQALLDEEKREKGKEYLNEILDKSAKLIESRVGENSDTSTDTSTDMSAESSDDEVAMKYKDIDDSELTIEQLREKYSSLPDVQSEEEEEEEDEDEDEDISDEEVSEEEVSEEEVSAEEEVSEDNDEEEEEDISDKPNLASLFGKVEDDSDQYAESESESERSERESVTEPKSEHESVHGSVHESDHKEQEAAPEEHSEHEKHEEHDGPEEPKSEHEDHKDVIVHDEQDRSHLDPSILLKGTLREYQLNGLDWMARLIQSGTNGILADEMGLGKTIQTIALMAWHAWHNHIWGPHLIVVPTSVMLNWEMEFKRFLPGFKILTYFGTPQQRKRKRRGWNKEDTWHVCITSYQLVIQDQAVFRGKKWQFLVLDEAHNIKNFRSQRWQALLNFNAQFRLLLTGTPLQNNLVELWSLLYFLMPSSRATQMMPAGFASLEDFQEWFAKPVDQMVEEGEEADDEARKTISKLHQILRPYLLRRLKIDVEKQMPGKYEHIIYCKLSKRQRYLYDDFMSRASTKETLESGNFMSILNCLMQLRKVCNHPDLFEVRPIVSSMALDNSVSKDFGDVLARKFTLNLELDTMFKELNMVFTPLEEMSKVHSSSITQLTTTDEILLDVKQLESEVEGDNNYTEPPDCDNLELWTKYSLYKRRVNRLHRLNQLMFTNRVRTSRTPVFGKDCRQFLNIFKQPIKGVKSYEDRQVMMDPIIIRFGCITPPVVCLDQPEMSLGTPISKQVYQNAFAKSMLFHEPQVRLSIAFPDKRLLQYDCGKLQKLAILLRDLISNGHRCLIFTQMTKVLDILEQFLNLHGWRYLRLDGATRIEQRQALTERFNKDENIPVFILSTRSGGLGINLTGADTVIFYDSDWNPAMDRQCQDRCHRIGQTRDVHIYRLVSEFTIESNILRKATQKTILDNVVIQEGDFTTEHFTKMSVHDILGDDAGRSINGPSLEELQSSQQATKKLELAMAATEDRDDQLAANLALDEAKMDQVEFEDAKSESQGAPSESQKPDGGADGSPTGEHVDGTPTENPVDPTDPTEGSVEILEIDEIEEPEQLEIGHIDDWMIKAIENYDLF